MFFVRPTMYLNNFFHTKVAWPTLSLTFRPTAVLLLPLVSPSAWSWIFSSTSTAASSEAPASSVSSPTDETRNESPSDSEDKGLAEAQYPSLPVS